MKTSTFVTFLLLFASWRSLGADVATGMDTLVRGWLSDEQCASARAAEGAYTQTNPDCARECVKLGKKIVLIDPSARRILLIANQQAAMKSIGDYVAIVGPVDAKSKTVYIKSIKVLQINHPSCARQKGSN